MAGYGNVANLRSPWGPGQSGNPGGVPRIARLVRLAAREDSEEAYKTIASIMRTGDKDAVRLAAALAILKLAGCFIGTGNELPKLPGGEGSGVGPTDEQIRSGFTAG